MIEYLKIKNTISKLRKKWKIKTEPSIKFEHQIETYEFLREVYKSGKTKDTAMQFYKDPKHGNYITNEFRKKGLKILFPENGGRKNMIDSELLVKIAIMKIAYRNTSDLNLNTILKTRGFLSETSSKSIWKILHPLNIHRKKREQFDETAGIKAVKEFQENEIHRFRIALQQWNPLQPPKDCTFTDFLNIGGEMKNRYEMIREVILNDQHDISQIAAKYNIFQEMYYEYIRRFLKFGMLGLFNKPKGRFTTPKASVENQILTIRAWEKGERTQKQIADDLGISLRTVVTILTEYNLTGTTEKVKDIIKIAKRVKYREARRDSYIEPAQPNEQKELFFARVKELRNKPEPLPIPAGFLIAPFINEFRTFEIFNGLGLVKFQGYDYGRLFILDLGRVFGGIPVIGGMTYVTDDGLALSAGLSKFPDQTTLHENIVRIGEDNLRKIKWSFTQEAKEFGQFSGIKTATDFHLSVFTGTDEEMLDRGKGPDTKVNKCLPGPRVMLAYDYSRDAFITYKVYDAKERASKVSLDFIENELEYVIGLGRLQSLVADAEFRGIKLYDRLTQKNVSFIFAVPINSYIKDQVEANPNLWGCYKDTELYCDWLYYEGKRTKYVLVVIKNEAKGKLHCFITNHNIISGQRTTSRLRAAYKILLEYHNRSKIEVCIRTNIASYYFDKVPTTEPTGAAFHYLSSLVANFIMHLLKAVFKEELGRMTLDTVRDIFLVKKKMLLRVEGNNFILTSLDRFQRKKHKLAFEMYKEFINKYDKSYSWLYGMGIKIE